MTPSRSQWPRGSSIPGIAGSNPAGDMDESLSCTMFVLSGRGLCDGPIPRPEESYRLWHVSECDQGENKNLDIYCE
jgi:hypothetical protein